MLELIPLVAEYSTASVLHGSNPTVLPGALEGMGLEEQ